MEYFSYKEKLENISETQDQIDDIIFELIKERKKRKITQKQLSVLSKVPQVTISRLESFSAIPTMTVLLKLLNTLDMKLSIIHERSSDE